MEKLMLFYQYDVILPFKSINCLNLFGIRKNYLNLFK